VPRIQTGLNFWDKSLRLVPQMKGSLKHSQKLPDYQKELPLNLKKKHTKNGPAISINGASADPGLSRCTLQSMLNKNKTTKLTAKP